MVNSLVREALSDSLIETIQLQLAEQGARDRQIRSHPNLGFEFDIPTEEEWKQVKLLYCRDFPLHAEDQVVDEQPAAKLSEQRQALLDAFDKTLDEVYT